MRKHVDVDLKKLSKDWTMTVKLNMTKELKIRLWIAKKLFHLGAFILGMGIVIEDNHD